MDRAKEEGFNLSRNSIIKIFDIMGHAKWLTEDKELFYIENKRNRLITGIKKILSVCSPIDASILKAGLRRNYRILKIPNKQTLLMFCKTIEDFVVDGDRIGSKNIIKPEDALGETEMMFYNIFKERGGAVSYTELKKICAEKNINEHTFEIYLSTSFIITSLKGGVYTDGSSHNRRAS